MLRTLVIAMSFLAPPALAQSDADPVFDGALLDTCLARHGAEGGEVCIGVAATPCIDSEAGTTIGMSYCLGEELKLWDARLNRDYGVVMAAAEATDAEMAELGTAATRQAPFLKQMQRDWIAFRDSACSYEGSRWGGGTGAGPAGTDCAMTLTARQALWVGKYRNQDEQR